MTPFQSSRLARMACAWGAAAMLWTSTFQVAAQTCALPASFSWNHSSFLVSAKNDSTHTAVAIKDPSVVNINGRYHVYATIRANNTWQLGHLNFADWAQASAASQFYLDTQPKPNLQGKFAPTLFYFSPGNLWYLVYMGAGQPQYSTSTNPADPTSWSAPKNFFSARPQVLLDNRGSGDWIDPWVICGWVNCYMFYADDNGHIYRARTPIGSFPGGFTDTVITLQDSNRFNLFEAPHVYLVNGQSKYLAIVEAIGANGRYFRSFTTDRLDGTWTPLAATEANPFAGKANVTYPAGLSRSDVSHGELVRASNNERMELDPCRLQFLTQSIDAATPSGTDYGSLPYKLGVLTPR